MDGLEAKDRPASALSALVATLMKPTDIAWLVAFRVLYGSALTISMLRFIHYGWIDRFFVRPRFFFKYWGFEWVQPLGAEGMHLLFWALVGCGVCITLGLAFRLAAAAFALGLTYIQLIDVSTYLNHYYLAALLAWLLALSPANRSYALDAWIARKTWRRGAASSETVATGWLYLLRFQVGVVYTFAGLAKAQPDWLIHAQPLRMWLSANTELPLLGPLFTIEAVPLFMSWFGFLFDTTIPWWLSFKKTRPYAYVVVVVFHVATRLLFNIGMFPVIMTIAALVFFSPSWPRELSSKLRIGASRLLRREIAPLSVEAAPSPLAAGARSVPSVFYKLAIGVGLAYCAFQLTMPMRYLAYGGNVLWHEQGLRFSWRVMLRAKGGSTTFVVRSRETGKVWHVSPRTYLNNLQESEMSSQPDLILQLAHHVREDFETRGYGPVEVYADSRVALNGRLSVPLVDQHVDLTTVEDGLSRADWVLPAPTAKPPHTRPVL